MDKSGETILRLRSEVAKLQEKLDQVTRERDEAMTVYRATNVSYMDLGKQLGDANLQVRDLRKKMALMVISNGGAITVKDRDVISFDPDTVVLEEFSFGPDYVIRVGEKRACLCPTPSGGNPCPVHEKLVDAPRPALPYSGAGTTEQRSEATSYVCVRCWIAVWW